MSLFEIEKLMGSSLSHGPVHLTPVSQIVRWQLPGSTGGLVWNRPVAVHVCHENGEEQILSVKDVTRQVQISLLGICLVVVILTWSTKRRSMTSISKETDRV